MTPSGLEPEEVGHRLRFEELRAEARRFIAWNLAQQGLRAGEIAEHLGIPKSTVRKYLRRQHRERAHKEAIERAYAAWCLHELQKLSGLDRRSQDAARRVRAYGGEVDLLVDLMAVIERDKAICHICGEPVEPCELAFDHVVPLVHGGGHTTENVRVAHSRCNSAKGARL